MRIPSPRFPAVLLLCFLLAPHAASGAAAVPATPARTEFQPGQVWRDGGGQPINAHGGGVLFHCGLYYWYGTHKIEGLSEAQHADGGVHAYASRDLLNWQDLGLVLPIDAPPSRDLTPGVNFDRPKVVYHAPTGRFVLFFKLYLRGHGTRVGFVGVATATGPAGPFVYQHKFLGGGSPEGTGDFAMFQDDDGTLYHLAVRKPDKAFVVGKMQDDYLLPAGPYEVAAGITRATEAPAVLKRDGRYWLLASGSTGWAPNAARSFSAASLYGPWVDHGNPCEGVNPHNGLGPELTYGGQSTFILSLPGPTATHLALFDINKPDHPYESLHVWLPISFETGRMTIPWRDQWSLEALPSSAD